MRLAPLLSAPVSAYVRLCASLDPLWVVSIMTLLSMVRFQEGAWFYSILYPVLLGLACLFPSLVRREQFWLAVCLVVGSSIALNWYFIANHTFSLFYWTLALLLSCFAHDRLRLLALSARWILGGIFLFAFIWKLASPDFQSGATMRYFLSATQPLGDSGVALSSLTSSELAQNMGAVERLLNTPGTGPTRLIMPPDLAALADLLTRLTQITEGLVVLILLTPLPERWRWLREASLLFFFATAYTLLPVAPLAAQFACLGYAMTSSSRSRAAFIAAFFVYQLMDLRLGSLWGAG
ncbi:hypothetical protein [Deinococcus sp.]|uniref:hypothetical protein n=1 Tax=Deinococcus sp. TaxID=47478 RepID=UPI0025DCAB28|nr:hypothetical protein [Deinococcus sp.]